MKRLLSVALCLALAVPAFAANPLREHMKLFSTIFNGVDVRRTKATDPVKMIYRYLHLTWNADDVAEFEIVKNADTFQYDTKVAGTVTLEAAIKEVGEGVDYILSMGEHGLHEDIPAAEKKQWKKKAEASLREMARLGCTFGFDGLRQNEGPTPFLLVIDPKGRAVYGCELSPSEW